MIDPALLVNVENSTWMEIVPLPRRMSGTMYSTLQAGLIAVEKTRKKDGILSSMQLWIP